MLEPKKSSLEQNCTEQAKADDLVEQLCNDPAKASDLPFLNALAAEFPDSEYVQTLYDLAKLAMAGSD